LVISLIMAEENRWKQGGDGEEEEEEELDDTVRYQAKSLLTQQN